jgi:TetR/AcrR family transcriptional regulator
VKKPPDNLAMKLLEATDRLPEEGGFDISIDEMARIVDVPRATLYYYFSGKDDLVEFYMNDKLERTAVAIEKAAAIEGDLVVRLEAVLMAILESLGKYPRMCVELPAAAKGLESFQSVMANAERWVVAPVREVLIEGRSTGVFDVVDPALTAVALMGALVQVGMFQVVSTGSIDVAATAEALVPQLLRGVAAR